MDTTGTTAVYQNNTSTVVAITANQSPTETNTQIETTQNEITPGIVSTTRVPKKRKRRKNKTDAIEPHDISQFESLKQDDLLSESNRGPKVVEKRGSAVSHFNFYLQLRVRRKIEAGEEKGKLSFDELSFEDVSTGPS